MKICTVNAQFLKSIGTGTIEVSETFYVKVDDVVFDQAVVKEKVAAVIVGRGQTPKLLKVSGASDVIE